MSQETADKLNEALHALIYRRPCKTACTHVVVGTWTILGIANVVGRHSDDDA